ncbi:MAG: glycosyltransferase family 2 protein [Gaiellaceae bacterium]
MPTHGPAPYLADAITSVTGASEIVVVEDGTAEVSAGEVAPARLIRLPKVGRSRARNAGVEAVSASLVAFLDADDLSRVGRLERQRASLESAPGAALCFGPVEVVDGGLRPIPEWNRLLARRLERLVAGGATYEAILASRCPIYTSATMVRRAAFLEAGGYDARFDAYEDLDLYLRLSRLGGLVPAPGTPVTTYRLHGANTDSDRLYEGLLGVVGKHLPDAEGRARRLLLERQVEALWGLRRLGDVRRAALRALAAEPRLLARPRLVARLLASLVSPRRRG